MVVLEPGWVNVAAPASVGLAAVRLVLGMAVRVTPLANTPKIDALKLAAPTYTPFASTPRVGKLVNRPAVPA